MLFKILLFCALFSKAQTSHCDKAEAPFLNEKLTYEVYWGLINVGKADITVTGPIEISSSCAYKIVSTAKSGSFIENFYPVNDYNESWPDITLSRSYGYYKDIREGGYKKKEKVLYDYSAKIFKSESENKKGEKKTSQGELKDNSMDILSSLFLMRLKEIKKGESILIPINTKENWEMKVIHRGEEKIETKAGKFKCDILEPQVGEEGIFAAKKGKKLLVYMSKDKKIPVLLKAEIFIGSITAKLVKAEKFN
ncbi:MAG: DUF3108 domain-containing protein [Elusimicrobiota bacterium]